MENSVYLRPLQVNDANISANWRNNPKIWRLTGAKPTTHITPEMEQQWLSNVLQRKNEKRFAICLKETDQYIGNIYLTDITDDNAVIHVFIGELAFWGGGRALLASQLLITYGFTELALKTISAHINPKNLASAMLAQTLGFEKVGSSYDGTAKSILDSYILFPDTFVKDTIIEQASSSPSV